ncbi:magnesium transporter CorA family protein [Novosphingobium sp. 9]|uniref:magnesium transporter CorA family protein n=1 Tax=Novosphingobium sp. 9 TaxID=2025349 RepID=UPI0021B6C7B4|nr:magnesium transporter CorA family protein [Novosphingobium sp. 9]
MLTSMLLPGTDFGGLWIDLCEPDDAEVRRVEARYGITIPALSALREIESSSRLHSDGETVSMTAPIFARGADVGKNEHWETAPAGFILTPEVLVTVRYTRLDTFDAAVKRMQDEKDLTPRMVLVLLLEEIVDRAADQIENVSEMAASISRTIFYTDLEHRGLDPKTAILRRTIIKLGRAADRSSRVRYMFLSVGRMASFVEEHCKAHGDDRTQARFRSIAHDIASLDEFETSLSGRVQFLLDAATSLIGIEQNSVVKVLTVASVIGVPPVLVVGIYGMNFKVMPELAWPWGYPFALALCVLSGVLPWLWFKWRRWI